MRAIEVGKELVPGHGPWPEVSEFNWLDNGYELMLRFSRPTAREVESVRRGECEFALAVEGGVIFFLYRFSAVPWSDAPFSWHLIPEARRLPMPVSESAATRAVLQVILIDAGTGIVKVIRAVSLSPEFTLALNDAIREQISTPFKGRTDHDRQVAAAYRKYPSTEVLLRAAKVRCKGGD